MTYAISLRSRNLGAVTISKPRQTGQVSPLRMHLLKPHADHRFTQSAQAPTIEMSPRSSNSLEELNVHSRRISRRDSGFPQTLLLRKIQHHRAPSRRCLGEALAAGGDYADLYFESVTATSLGVDEQIVKIPQSFQGTSAGCGIRVLSGERTGYAYTDNLSPERLLHAARTAALIASGPAKQTVQGFVETLPPRLPRRSLSRSPRRI